MNKILIFANPFGYGPSGKAISIANYLSKNAKNSKVYVCGGRYLSNILDKKLNYIEVNERNQKDIDKLLDNIEGEKFIISSQNRFAVKAGLKKKIPTSFLDGLSWFWKNIPKDHFIADIIFWLNYPNASKKIPTEFENRISLIGGISENANYVNHNKKQDGILFYLGGCKNPLTDLPTSYLDLFANLFSEVLEETKNISLSTDSESMKYFKKYSKVYEKLRKYNHSDFLLKIASSNKFIGNGGQTATTEAANLNVNIFFFLPINLSQLALIEKLNEIEKYDHLSWKEYVKVPKNIFDYNEKDAIKFFNTMAKKILLDKEIFNKLKTDLTKLLTKENNKTKHKLFEQLGSSGAEDIYRVLNKKWKI